MPAERRSVRAAIWLRPFLVLFGTATALFLVSFFADRGDGEGARSLTELLLAPNTESAMNTLGNVAEVVAAVLGVAITVVSIIVELAANRYTSRIAELFFRDPVNFIVMGFFVVSCVQCMWVILEFDPLFAPRIGTAITMVLMTVSLLALLPYFAYVFAFLNPAVVIDRIRAYANDAVSRLGPGARLDVVVQTQRDAADGVEQLSDVALNAIEGKDKGISMAAVDALRALASRYMKDKGRLPETWFRMAGEITRNPDFVSMSPQVLEEIGRRRTWFEMKVLRQYETIYAETLNKARDVNYRIAINTRQIAEQALAAADREVIDLAVKFFNTYLRATINAKDVRTAYNVLNQYRLLGEAAVRAGAIDLAGDVAHHFKYYGQTAYGQKLPFILEVAAYDLCGLCEIAHETRSAAHGALLRTFLEVDKESESHEQEQSLRGVRKAQVKLATYYLEKGDEPSAREIFEDMKGERPERLASIRDEILAIDTKDFWEIIDRGANFDYLPPSRKERMAEFFAWFGDRVPPPTKHDPAV